MGVQVDLGQGVIVTFDDVKAAGDTSLVTSSMGPPPPTGFRFGMPPVFYDISTTATFNGIVEVCINYDDSGLAPAVEANLRLVHRENNAWADVTSSLDTINNVICGEVTNFSLFLPAELIPEEDFDGDGCTNEAELRSPAEAATGGGRDPLYYWDFMDMWVNKDKDKVVDIIDIGAIVQRLFTAGDPGGDPLDPPQALTGYHVSADRSPPILGLNLWNAGPPDGDINIIEIGLTVAQFLHDCN